MALKLVVNGRDLTTYNRMAHGDGHEPASADAFDPQFTGSTAIGEGQTFVGNSLGNVAMSFPLILKAASTDALYQLIRDIRTDLVKGNTVEYQSGGATQSTFFDMESGKLEPQFEFWLDQNARCRAQLTIWRRPYGHTGTSRVIASAAGTGPMTITATGVLGDVNAQGVLNVRLAGATTQGSNPTAQIMYGVKYPAPSGFNPLWDVNRFTSEGFSGNATPVTPTTMASGRIGNKYMGYYAGGSALGLGTSFTQGPIAYLPPQTYPGRYRVIANIRTSITMATSANRIEVGLQYAAGLAAAVNNKVSLASCQNWTAIDLGEINVANGVATGNLQLKFSTRTVASPVGTMVLPSGLASHCYHVDGITLIPLDAAAGLTVPGAALSHPSSINAVDTPGRLLSYATGVAASPLISAGGDYLRGNWPTIPPTGSPGASGAAQVVILPLVAAATTAEPLGNREHRVHVAVRERFSYLR